jgi:hypothetical protein
MYFADEAEKTFVAIDSTAEILQVLWLPLLEVYLKDQYIPAVLAEKAKAKTRLYRCWKIISTAYDSCHGHDCMIVGFTSTYSGCHGHDCMIV